MTTLNKDLSAIQLSQVIEQLNNLADYDIIAIHNEYCEANNDSYSHITDNDDEAIDSMFNTPSEAIRAASFGDYNHSHDYFILNGYGNLVSFNYVSDDNCPIDISELAEWLISEDKLSDYDITVTTLDDKYNIILDHINDIDSVSSIQSLLSYLSVDFIYTNEWLSLSENNTIDNYIEKYINIIIVHFIDKEYNEQLDGLLEYFNIEL